MCLALKKIADEYVMKVARVEKEVLRASVKSHLTIAHLRHSFSPYRTLFMYFFDILFECESLSLCGGELLNCLHEKCKVCAPSVKPHLKFVLSSVERTFYRQLTSWVSDGIINDRYHDFFVFERDTHFQSSRHGSQRKHDQMSFEYMNTRTQRNIKTPSFRQNRLYIDSSSAERAWKLQFVLRLDRVPTAYISYEVAEKILFIGKGVKLLNEFRKMINRNRDSPSKHRLNTLLDGTNGPIKKFKDAIARLLDPSVDFSMSILELEVNLVYNATSHQLYDLLIKDSHLNMHLEALKD